MLRAVALLWVFLPVSARAVETIRISMGESDSVVVSGSGLSTGPDTDDAEYAPMSLDRAVLRNVRGKLELSRNALLVDAVRLRALGDSGTLRVGKMSVRGDVVVQIHRDRLLVVNVLPLEEYLVAVLGSEMPKSFPEEALKAQAVAARTYALHKKIESYGQQSNLGSSVLHQVYGGLRSEDPRTRAAVEATSGQVLTFDLVPIEAYFHASCGGRTESGQDALSRPLPYLVPADCPCGGAQASTWSLRLDEPELTRIWGQKTSPSSWWVASRTGTGRVRALRAEGERVLDAVSLRQKVGYNKLKSLAFTFEPQGNGLLLSGKGFGHGAGLCQWGAKMLADKGWDYMRILQHYYLGTELQQLY